MSTRSALCHLNVAFGRRWVWALLVALMWPGLAWAHDHILEKAYWTDVSGAATFDQARAASYTPYTGVLSKGFGPQAQWIRLKIGESSHAETKALVLRIRPVFLDEITLYDPAEPALGRGVRRTGDKTPFSGNEFESLNHSFVIPAQPAPREVWLRLVTTSTQLMHVEALDPREMLREEQRLWLVYSGLLAVIFSCLTWVLLAWSRDRDPVNGIFVLRQTVLLLYTACFLGYHRILLADLISPGAQDKLYSWLVLLTSVLSWVFEYRFLSEYATPRWAHGLMRLLLACSLTAMLLMVMGQEHAALHLNTFFVGAMLCMLFVISIRIRPKPHKGDRQEAYTLPRVALIAYYFIIVSVLGLSILPGLGVEMLQGSTLAIYGVILYGLGSGLLMSILLVVRSRQMERLRQEVDNNLFLSSEQLALETRRRQDQSQLLDMLMHELKTPLAVIDLALKDRGAGDKVQGYVARAIENMKSILNRCVQMDRLVERPFDLQRQRFDLAQQLRQWLHDHKPAQGRHELHGLSTALLETDLQCVQIIASNLLENALKYGDPQQPVRLSLQAQLGAHGQAGVCLQVCNAPGAAGWPDADKLFAKYYRSAAAQRQSGTGLGLFLSHNLAQQLGGELRYRPDASHICFELWLPT